MLRYWNPFGLLDDGSSKVIITKKVGTFDVKIIMPKALFEKENINTGKTSESDSDFNNANIATLTTSHSKID